ncbi:HsdR family type I site-specific deoxyribonuclease [Bradymonadaceae bacterium TMQ3]|nr:HsdR family type I site-specific deoxyribonuclease [Bradymonadaceae bacterium TMQ3]TXC76497.1 HsdR family type I site-specific deoxyribonuclease [Bradymonadales bacterium TMQ1]
MLTYTESHIEQSALRVFADLGYEVLHGPDIAPDQPGAERESYKDVVLRQRLDQAIRHLNPGLPADAYDEALRRVLHTESPSLVENNRRFHRLFCEGVPVEIRRPDGRTSGEHVRLVDFEKPENNDWAVVNQFTIKEGKKTRRPDILVFVNGLPLGVIELKSLTDEHATVESAYHQIQTYKQELTELFVYNGVNVLSDSMWARIGSLTAPLERYMPWRTVDGTDLVPLNQLQLEPLLRGVFEPGRFLDLLRNFVVFHESDAGLIKILGAYHQFHAARTALEQTIEATQPEGDRRAGVVWHTQGSGKSLTMTFFAGKVIADKAMNNPTLVVLTDRNDLDDQLFSTFAKSKELLRQTPVQAASRDHLKELLQVASGGVVFTTIQKFFPDDKFARHPLLSERENIVVIADEAHRSQYGFVEGFARHMRNALPNASFIGFTGTPVELEDKSTRTVFGDYISIYDIEQAIEDNATVPIYYESRLARLHLDDQVLEDLDDAFDRLTEDTEDETRERLKAENVALESIAANPHRVDLIADDLLAHFDRRTEALEGKAMVVCISREACVAMYEAIVRRRPEWNNDDDALGGIKVIMTGDASDPSNFQPHLRSKSRRDAVGRRFKDPDDGLKMVIVCDMWLTGFDAPCAHTMYIDKPMKGHTLMQAVARVNRVFRDKPGGLVVDYIGIANSLREALRTYTESGGKGRPKLDLDEAVEVMLKQFEIVQNMLHGFDYAPFIEGTCTHPGQLIADAANFILDLEDGRERFKHEVSKLSRAYALAGAHERAKAIHDEVAFFQQVRGLLAKVAPGIVQKRRDVEQAVKQLVSQAISTDEVIDILGLAGIERPDISILSDQFLKDVANLRQKNLAIELLRKIIEEELHHRARQNLVQSRTFSEMLRDAVVRFQNRSLETAEMVQELMELARKVREAIDRDDDLGLSPEELAFYDALSQSESAREIMGDTTLRQMAVELTRLVRGNVSIDWSARDSAQAKLRTLIKRFLRRYGYPPDQAKIAMDTVLEQADLFGDEWAEDALEATADAAEPASDYPFALVPADQARPFENCVPLLDLKVAAGHFSAPQTVAEFSTGLILNPDTTWVALPDHLNPRPGFFVARVVGDSMNRRIPPGSYCLFRLDPGGSRQGKVVLASHHDIQDPWLGAGYTVKIYRSTKTHADDGTWHHAEIRLEPDSTNPAHEPIVLSDAEEGEFRVVAELVGVLG